jgi:TPP-dependent pyruvate/acetoin dehydrogenase alpha subunit
MELENQDLIELFRLMLLTRRFEEKTQELLPSGKLQDFCHTCIGQEHITVGACYKLKKTDLIMPSLRGRGAYIAKGVPIKTLLAVMYGKQLGSTMPKESPHHLGLPEYGVLVGTGIIGSDIAKATGAALAAKLRGTTQVVIDFFGDGASNRGDFHEALNLAAIWKLPVVYICENNHTAMSTSVTQSTAVEDIADRAKGYDIPGVIIERNDVLAVHDVVQKAVSRARDGGGPTLIECKTYRWSVHAGLPSLESRSKKEIEFWKKKLGYPIMDLKKQLLLKRILTEQDVLEIKGKIKEDVAEAIEFAEKNPFPAVEEAFKHVYA